MKKSFGDCKKCPLIDQHLVIGETNCKDDLKRIKLLVLAEAPANEEIKLDIPLIGKAGKVFRKGFEISKLKTLDYYISNVCLCANIQPNGTTENPPKEAVECCKANWEKMIEVMQPELVIIMGAIPLKIFGIDGGITKCRGKYFKYKNTKVLPTFHPSYLMRNGGLGSELGNQFLEDLSKAYRKLTNSEEIKATKLDKTYTITLPDWCYGEDVCLYDIQHYKDRNEIIYIFKLEDGSRKLLRLPDSETYFYILENSSNEDAPTTLPVEDVLLVKNEKYVPANAASYEYKLRVEQKHAIDYRYNRGKLNSVEPIFPLKIQYMDIEIYNEGSKAFPNVKTAGKPINSISFLNGEGNVNVFLLKSKHMDDAEIQEFENIDVQVFTKEKDLLKAYFKATADYAPDVITAWNGNGFDFPYIHNRCKKIRVNPNLWSPLGKYSYETRWETHDCLGTCFIDLLDIYKRFVEPAEGKKESYKLDYIAKIELEKGKVAYEGSLDEVYEKDINKFIEYSGIDTNLLSELEAKRKYIELLAEMIRTCSSTWKYSNSTMGLVDPLIVKYAKDKGIVCRDPQSSGEKVKFEGAFVNDPVPGMHRWVTDLDFTSLYPSIICTYNIDTGTYIAKLNKDVASSYIYDRDNVPDNFNVIYDPWRSSSKPEKVSKDEFEKFLADNEAIISINGTVFKGHNKEFSFIGEVCNFILESRKRYKSNRNKCERNSDEYQVNDNRQLVFKIVANSLYGVLGNKHFRMYNLDLAEAITSAGQEVNRFSQYHVGHYLKTGTEEIDNDFYRKTLNENPPYIIAGDTDSLFLSIGGYLADKKLLKKDCSQEEIIDTVLDISKDASDFLNDDVIPRFVKMHGIDNKNSKLFLKQEVVAKRSLFFNKKKRYALHIVNREGYPRDEYDIKGMIIRRSDYPSYTKECIGKILDMLLKTEKVSFSDISDYIIDIEEKVTDMCMSGDKRVARPVSCKADDEYKRIPSHVLGAKLWNVLEYNYFVPGTRGYLFKIRDVDVFNAPKRVRDKAHLITEKNNNIVLPFEEPNLPDYYTVDVPDMVEFAWTKRYSELLEPIMDVMEKFKRRKK